MTEKQTTTTTVAFRRRVDFFHDVQDRKIMVAALLGWRVKDIALLANMTPGQVYYRIHHLLKISVSKYRGENTLSLQILKAMEKSTLMDRATGQTLRAADITLKMDTDRKILRD